MLNINSRIHSECQKAKTAFQPGDEIVIIQMLGEPQYAGRRGTVTTVDDAGQIHGTWGGCAVIPGVDSFRKVCYNADNAGAADAGSKPSKVS